MHAGRLVPGYVSRHWWAVGMKACLRFAEKSTLVLWYVLWVEVWRCQDSGSFSVTNQSWVDYWLWTIDGGYSWWYCCKLRPLSKIVEGVHKKGFIPAFRILLVFSRYFPLARLRGEVHSKHRCGEVFHEGCLYSLHCQSWSAFHQTLHTWNM